MRNENKAVSGRLVAGLENPMPIMARARPVWATNIQARLRPKILARPGGSIRSITGAQTNLNDQARPKKEKKARRPSATPASFIHTDSVEKYSRKGKPAVKPSTSIIAILGCVNSLSVSRQLRDSGAPVVEVSLIIALSACPSSARQWSAKSAGPAAWLRRHLPPQFSLPFPHLD